ncbi:hypothetical protein GLOIN_2v1783681 [Rhizophagus irregularis DAOM 181602=DAOM 197198]|uniref:Uncharacterized protein n=2 Tax=Rhizophagus irregularis TaxID=588596 RepID=A0A015IZ83_RHIIW|nr:hypothetical protein RirG_186750 [Rhizophagus irregularis DAOM 197198w]GBC23665.1 hypothetical protein GLOIN_2v1783681 [Rhizophagus irregularis DAOM 181602=DAOM 197198]
MELSVPLVKLVKFDKNQLYREIRYIEDKLIIDYDNPFQIPIPIYQGLLLMFRYIKVPVYRISLCIIFK